MVFAGRSETFGEVHLNVNGQTTSQSLSVVDLGESETIYARSVTVNHTVSVGSTQNISVEYAPTSSESQAWLDYIEMRTNKWNRLESTPIHLSLIHI